MTDLQEKLDEVSTLYREVKEENVALKEVNAEHGSPSGESPQVEVWLSVCQQYGC